MAYRHDKWIFRNSIDHEYKYSGNYGAKGEKRVKRKKATPEQMKKQNQRNKEKRVWRKIRANFQVGDHWATLKYPKGTKKAVNEVLADMRNFLRTARGKYKRLGSGLKYIYRIEMGKKGGIHIHIIINRIPSKDSDRIIEECWKWGMVNFQSLYSAGDFKVLASYITKQAVEEEEEYKQLELFDEKEKRSLIRISSSRNLIEPKAERKEYTRKTMRKVLEGEITPTQGFYIDKNSIVQGVNPYTGKSYLHYTEYRTEVQKGEWENDVKRDNGQQ